MAGRYQELYRLPANLYLEGSPVIIEAGALQKDLTDDKVLAQLKLRNLSLDSIVACKVSVRAFEPNGNEVQGVKDFAYLDIKVANRQEFGTKTPIYLPDKITRKISVAVTEVVFANNSIWSAEENEWAAIPAQRQILESIQDPETLKQYYIEIGEKLPFIPEVKRGLFLCACGNITLESIGRCSRCGRRYEDFSRALDQNYLNEKKEVRLKKEREEQEERKRQAERARIEREKREQEEQQERERQEELARIKREEIRRKFIKRFRICSIVAAGIVGIIFLWIFLIAPLMKYNQAISLMENGQFEEAKGAFDELDGFGSSSKKLTVLNAIDDIKEEAYERAIKSVLREGVPVRIMYNFNGGYSPSGDEFYYEKDEDFISFMMPQKEGYKFVEWHWSEYNYIYDKDYIFELTLEAVWSDEWKISYNLDGGNAYNLTEYHKDGEAIILNSPKKAGYTFVGWSGTDIDGVAEEVTIPAGSYGDRTYTAHWEAYGKITYKMVGDNVSNPSEYSFRDKTFTLNNPTRDGYTFIGWTGTDLTGMTMTVTIPTGSHGDRDYTANWKGNEYTITLDANGGKVDSSTISVSYSSKYSLPVPQKDGYDFDGWYNGTQRYPGGTWFTTRNLTLTAKWVPMNYEIKYNLNGGTNSSLNPTTFTVESSTISLKEPTRKGYKFVGWYKDKAFTKKISQITTGSRENETVYAKWEIITYTITYDLNGGTISGTQKTSFTVNDLPLRLPSATKSGFVFLNWGKDTYDGVPVEKITDLGNITLVASYVDPYLQFGYSKDGTYCGVVSYSGTSTSLEIPAYYNGVPVRVINSKAFADGQYSSNHKSTIVSVKLPKTITVIGDSAFRCCENLKSINIPNGVIDINDYAFYKCTNLISISLPESLEKIGEWSFANCKSLKDISLPSSLKSIDLAAFEECTSLKRITIPGGINEIGGYVFHGCTGLTNVYINEGVTEIGYNNFNGCYQLNEIVLPTTLKYIENNAFSGCKRLAKIIIPEKTTNIGTAFSNCNNLTIYCRAKMVQPGWDKGWNGNCPVVWGYTGN